MCVGVGGREATKQNFFFLLLHQVDPRSEEKKLK